MACGATGFESEGGRGSAGIKRQTPGIDSIGVISNAIEGEGEGGEQGEALIFPPARMLLLSQEKLPFAAVPLRALELRRFTRSEEL